MRIFKLPDLGEGLQEAEILAWHVAVGQEVRSGQPLVSVETAKAVVDIPAPYSGRIVRLFGAAGEVAHTGAPLVGFEGDPDRPDAGTVVGSIETGADETAGAAVPPSARAPGVRAVPAVRALARRLGVDLGGVAPSGPDGSVTTHDVEKAARMPTGSGTRDTLRGVRRAMAQAMTAARAEVAAATLMEDADVDAWPPGTRILARLVRALIAGVRAEPALNAWYDGDAMCRRLIGQIDLGLAVDTPDGLFVPVLRGADTLDRQALGSRLASLIEDVRARRLPPEDLRGATITLTNYGTIAGRYAVPIVVPPTVAILGAGRLRDTVVPVAGRAEVHPVIPLSLTFDHRCVTGGEAGRFLAAVIADLECAD